MHRGKNIFSYVTGSNESINEKKTANLHILGFVEMQWPNSGQLVSDEVMVLYIVSMREVSVYF